MKLLKMLSDDAHVSLRKMGREVGLSTSGVRRRVKQLERFGLIKQYSALIDPQKFGYGVMAFVSIDVDSRSMRELVRSLSRCHQVCELHHTTGGHGLMLKVRARDVESLKKFVDDHIQSFDSVKSVRTIVAMETIKERLLNL
ncbi:MAG: Lrp/AsnC family transcriptional regulator [Hadesarchaea archaeon]|nr:MAG: Lrp/AsnC family transcriptional regulator [Hadesarchaea archaeon]